jgi:DNA-directed RNA polymerase subunit H (RpoH/RPB5)
MPDIIDVEISEEISNKSIAIKASNTIIGESMRNSNFLIILNIYQHNRPGLLHELLDYLAPTDYCKVFFADELLGFPIGNKMVPKHELCTKDMVQELLQKHHILVDRLPKILLRDPVVRWYGWQVGDVIKITRHNGELYYRIVVEKTF